MVVGFVGVVADVDRYVVSVAWYISFHLPTYFVYGVDRDGRMDVALNDAGTRVMLFKNTSPRRPWICITPQVRHNV